MRILLYNPDNGVTRNFMPHLWMFLLQSLTAPGHDVVLIDAPPVLPLADMGLFEKVVDGIILIVRAEKTPRGSLLQAIDTLATDKLVGIVLNDMRQLRSSYYRYVYKKT